MKHNSFNIHIDLNFLGNRTKKTISNYIFVSMYVSLNTIHSRYYAKVSQHLIDILDSKRSFGRSKLEKNISVSYISVFHMKFNSTLTQCHEKICLLSLRRLYILGKSCFLWDEYFVFSVFFSVAFIDSQKFDVRFGRCYFCVREIHMCANNSIINELKYCNGLWWDSSQAWKGGLMHSKKNICDRISFHANIISAINFFLDGYLLFDRNSLSKGTTYVAGWLPDKKTNDETDMEANIPSITVWHSDIASRKLCWWVQIINFNK